MGFLSNLMNHYMNRQSLADWKLQPAGIHSNVKLIANDSDRILVAEQESNIRANLNDNLYVNGNQTGEREHFGEQLTLVVTVQ